jgi:hydroxymethylpyrimidine pyrophosphatase-like HAD family hydrolase
MSERDISAVLSDVDSTLIMPSRSLPSLAVQAAAHGLRASGRSLHTVTARPQGMHDKLVEPLALQDNLCVLNGGATVVRANSGEIVWSQHLSVDTVSKIITGIGGLCTNIHFDAKSKGYTPDEVISWFSDGQTPIEEAPSVFAIFGTERGEEILQALSGIAGIHHTPILGHDKRPDSRCIQVVAPGVDKQFGVEQMLRLADLSDHRVLAIGDGMNDISLFAAVGPDGVKVAINNENTPDELKDLADWVAPSVDDDGFAVAMERYGLVAT